MLSDDHILNLCVKNLVSWVRLDTVTNVNGLHNISRGSGGSFPKSPVMSHLEIQSLLAASIRRIPTHLKASVPSPSWLFLVWFNSNVLWENPTFEFKGSVCVMFSLPLTRWPRVNIYSDGAVSAVLKYTIWNSDVLRNIFLVWHQMTPVLIFEDKLLKKLYILFSSSPVSLSLLSRLSVQKHPARLRAAQRGGTWEIVCVSAMLLCDCCSCGVLYTLS